MGVGKRYERKELRGWGQRNRGYAKKEDRRSAKVGCEIHKEMYHDRHGLLNYLLYIIRMEREVEEDAST